MKTTRRRFAKVVGVSAAAAALPPRVQAQRPAQKAPPVVSPEVAADGRVTLRLYAPNAKEVLLSGDLLRPAGPAPARQDPPALSRNAEGIWSITIGPLEPNIYSYSFSVDGARITDPNNPLLKTGIRAASSMVEVRGPEPRPWDDQRVPHGTLHIETYQSNTLDRTRRFYVYTPPGYGPPGRAKLPTLYLLHGAGDDESGWSHVGRAHLILDNLLAEKKAKEMLVVMPFGHALPTGDIGGGRRAENVKKFEQDLLQDLLPFFENRYRARKEPEQRGIVGLSMGGEQALSVGTRHPELFRWVGGFSSALFTKELEQSYGPFFGNPDAANKNLKLLWVGCGKQDFLIEGNRAFVEALKQRGIRHVFRETEGAHTWTLWRQYLAEFVPLLFRA